VILYACTSNPGKLAEFMRAAPEIQALPGIRTIPAPEETGATFEENAALKAIYYSGFVNGPVFADDSGLEVDSLGGEPGVYSARYAGPAASDQQNNQLLLERLRTAMNRHARFVCAIALADQGKLITTVRGTVQGEILEQPRGAYGFGYDPLFFYPPLDHSFGELGPEEKFSVSHRGQAFRLLLSALQDIKI
jgi:XTP/dITP diphosphohydrolase